MASTVNIKGLDKAELLVRLFGKAPCETMARLSAYSEVSKTGCMSLRKSAREELAHNMHVRWFLASPIEVDFSGDEVDPTRYDGLTRHGTFAQIVAQMRREETPECSVVINELNKAELLVRLYVYARDPSMDAHDAEERHYMTAFDLIHTTTYIDAFLGYPIKTELGGRKADPREYDRLYGEGTFARVVEELLQEQ